MNGEMRVFATEKIICLGVGTINYCQCVRVLQKWRVLIAGIASRI